MVGIARRTVTDSARRIGRGNLRGGGVRWVDVSGAEWRLKREGSGGRLLSLHGATHGGVKHGETVRMIDGILRRCRHAMGVYSPLPFAGELDAHTINRNPHPPLLVIPVVWWGTSTWWFARNFFRITTDDARNVGESNAISKLDREHDW